MLRHVAVLVAILSAGTLAFLGTSHALASPLSSKNSPSTLGALKLPKANMPKADATAFMNAFGQSSLDEHGVSDDSFANARIITRTKLGSLYALPTTKGVCLALGSTYACTDHLFNDDDIATMLLVPDENGVLVGGGLTAGDASSVNLDRHNGSRLREKVDTGRFVVTESDNLSAIPTEANGFALSTNSPGIAGDAEALSESPLTQASSGALATYHCRNYLPLRDPDVRCAENGFLSGGVRVGQTPGKAYRDRNELQLDWPRTVSLWYGGEGDPHTYAKTDHMLTVGGTPYAYANCSVNATAGVYGYCWTTYH